MSRFHRKQVCVALLTVLLAAAGCGQKELRYRVDGPLDPSPADLGPLKIEALPINTADLDKDHPFAWRGSPTAGFMLFDVKIVNGSDRDLVYLVGHPDFPALVSPKLTARHFVPEALNTLEAEGKGGLISADQLELAVLVHERPAIFLEEGYRYQSLDHHEFFERYMYLMQKEMRGAAGWAFVPYAGGAIASSKIHGASERMQERRMAAEQMVLRPGVVPANAVVRGYVVFAWPPNAKAGSLTLRLPVQPGQAVSLRYNLLGVDRTQAPADVTGAGASGQPASH